MKLWVLTIRLAVILQSLSYLSSVKKTRGNPKAVPVTKPFFFRLRVKVLVSRLNPERKIPLKISTKKLFLSQFLLVSSKVAHFLIYQMIRLLKNSKKFRIGSSVVTKNITYALKQVPLYHFTHEDLENSKVKSTLHTKNLREKQEMQQNTECNKNEKKKASMSIQWQQI